MLERKKKDRVIKKFQTHKNDTGSPQVQIAILSEEVKDLTKHLQEHKKDHSSRRGLLKKVAERKKLLKYLQNDDEKSFIKLVKELGLKIGKKMWEEKAREDEILKLSGVTEEVEKEIIEKETANTSISSPQAKKEKT